MVFEQPTFEKPLEAERTIMFGNGSMAEFSDCMYDAVTDKYTFFFRPTKRMRYKDKVKAEDYDQRFNWIPKVYDGKYCHCLDISPDFQTWFLVCDYYNNPTDFIKNFDQALLAQNKSLKGERDAYLAAATLIPLKMIKMIKFTEEHKTMLLKEMQNQTKVLNVSLYPTPEKDQIRSNPQ